MTGTLTNSHKTDKSARRRRKHCVLAADPLFGCLGWPKFNQLEMVTTFICKPSLVRINACNFELSW